MVIMRPVYICLLFLVFSEAISEDDKKTEGPPEKSKRTWEKWSPSDKAVFFEALNDFGKNFQAIQDYIAKKKMKNKSGQDQVRNRDQIRFFYYRTLNKISKYVQFPPGTWYHDCPILNNQFLDLNHPGKLVGNCQRRERERERIFCD